jgi:EAL domain-containing protein (putative c-di-GMP-specific phosphodiesterase class I)
MVEASYLRRLRQRILGADLREGSPSGRLEVRQVICRTSGEDPVNDAIVRLIVDFAHTLGLEVTAERVENERQVASLTVMRCDLAQGFYFSKPLGGEAAG